MKLPPSLLFLRVTEGEHTKCRLWLPLFLLWPLLTALVVLALLMVLLADVGFRVAGKRSAYTRLAIGCLSLLCETRGTQIHVQNEKHFVGLTVC
jgi:hypothetical protein